ncbi:MAG: hypothetical protein LBH47_00290 [Christensenellaceae bacterium]|jgi:hypothetical protein|nr:hypothetical protein [Christensenellaceae bacterium]
MKNIKDDLHNDKEQSVDACAKCPDKLGRFSGVGKADKCNKQECPKLIEIDRRNTIQNGGNDETMYGIDWE